jgi:hypothetical protein
VGIPVCLANYTYNITDPTNKLFTFDHTGGSKADAKDSLKEIEFGVFEFEDANRDKQDDDGNCRRRFCH